MRLRNGFPRPRPRPRIDGESAYGRRRSRDGGDEGAGNGSQGLDYPHSLYRQDFIEGNVPYGSAPRQSRRGSRL